MSELATSAETQYVEKFGPPKELLINHLLDYWWINVESRAFR